jgi:hypothetical protein
MGSKLRIIAFYLPQFYPFKENDEWWGKGFTEWTNVGKAKALFRGHYQPRVPSDLGYYDLRIPENRALQAEMARRAGIEGFCYWHYWFDDNRQMMQRVFDEVLSTGEPDFPFCLGWANHSWYAKTWNKDMPNKLLCEQKYLGINDYNKHFKYALKAFKDYRYIKIEGNPVFYVFDPIQLPEDFIPYWNKLAKENGFEKVCFIARITNMKNEKMILQRGFDYLAPERLNDIYALRPLLWRVLFRAFRLMYWRPKFCYDYRKAHPTFINPDIDTKEYVIPSLIPQWDHSPRSGNRGTILHNSTPNLFRMHIKKAFSVMKNKKNKILFLKSWNEWAEGNYMEPDLKYGMQYINVLREEIEILQKNESSF